MSHRKIIVGISIGDANGIGPELIIKCFINPHILKQCIPVIYGSSKIISYHKKVLGYDDFKTNQINPKQQPKDNMLNVVNLWDDTVKINIGVPDKEVASYAIKALSHACEDLKAGKIDCLVTLPINKKTVQESGFKHIGHTEYLKDFFDVKENLMLMVSHNLRVAVATGHIPLCEVGDTLSKDVIIKKTSLLNMSLIKDFGVQKPKIAILGLNPHSGDNGAIGKEEIDIIKPAIDQLNKENIFCFGPFSADGFFGTLQYRKYDGVMAMYHDQGLAPFKSLAFDTGVNFTAGLPVVRTSPDHGPAYDLAGKNVANESSFRNSIYTAIDIFNQRKSFKEHMQTPLKSAPLSKD
ncbi:MAG TPA: 4-hydroxythreonine-4-phosphate dehydrogenase PdxA [Bacteroidetes bacterium]|nr:4-hydroxythreonine-4-phosphate dehydrogenase PdxA [Bacteroidota bacterium]